MTYSSRGLLLYGKLYMLPAHIYAAKPTKHYCTCKLGTIQAWHCILIQLLCAQIPSRAPWNGATNRYREGGLISTHNIIILFWSLINAPRACSCIYLWLLFSKLASGKPNTLHVFSRCIGPTEVAAMHDL